MLFVFARAAQAQTKKPAGPPPGSRQFWAVLDGARAGGGSCEQIAGRLEAQLRAMPASALEQFAQAWAAWWRDSYRWDLWGAAYLINGGSSDDGFDYFRGWLLTRGSAAWARASRGPDTAFDDVVPGTQAECEEIVGTLPNVYEERFRRDAPDAGQRQPSGQGWTEATLPQRLPRLARRFGGGA